MQHTTAFARWIPHDCSHLEQCLHTCGLEINLLHLVKPRASQLNGCAYRIDMHWTCAAPARASSG